MILDNGMELHSFLSHLLATVPRHPAMPHLCRARWQISPVRQYLA